MLSLFFGFSNMGKSVRCFFFGRFFGGLFYILELSYNTWKVENLYRIKKNARLMINFTLREWRNPSIKILWIVNSKYERKPIISSRQGWKTKKFQTDIIKTERSKSNRWSVKLNWNLISQHFRASDPIKIWRKISKLLH